jgi:glycosyltransferase involved in cell wall biosynthesis
LKIAYVTWKNPYDKKTWSGTEYSMITSLEKEHSVTHIKPSLSKLMWYILNLKEWYYKKTKGEKYRFIYDISIAKRFGKQAVKEIEKSKYDIIFAPDSTTMAFLNTNTPKIYLSDATFNLILDYYPQKERNMESGDKVERKALENTDGIMIPSKWAKENIVNYYGIKEEKVKIVPFGANMEKIPKAEELKKDISEVIELLFVGVDFERKGGAIAVEALKILNKRGIKSKLTIIGCNPEIKDMENITIIPYLNKNIKEDAQKMYDLYLNSDIFILPTRAECAGIVFCEASAFGMPIVATKTGGVSQSVNDGENGYCLDIEAGAKEYADKIEEITKDKEEYIKFRKRTREKFDRELNWNSWLLEFNKLAEKLIKEKK